MPEQLSPSQDEKKILIPGQPEPENTVPMSAASENSEVTAGGILIPEEVATRMRRDDAWETARQQNTSLDQGIAPADKTVVSEISEVGGTLPTDTVPTAATAPAEEPVADGAATISEIPDTASAPAETPATAMPEETAPAAVPTISAAPQKDRLAWLRRVPLVGGLIGLMFLAPGQKKDKSEPQLTQTKATIVEKASEAATVAGPQIEQIPQPDLNNETKDMGDNTYRGNYLNQTAEQEAEAGAAKDMEILGPSAVGQTLQAETAAEPAAFEQIRQNTAKDLAFLKEHNNVFGMRVMRNTLETQRDKLYSATNPVYKLYTDLAAEIGKAIDETVVAHPETKDQLSIDTNEFVTWNVEKAPLENMKFAEKLEIQKYIDSNDAVGLDGIRAQYVEKLQEYGLTESTSTDNPLYQSFQSFIRMIDAAKAKMAPAAPATNVVVSNEPAPEQK